MRIKVVLASSEKELVVTQTPHRRAWVAIGTEISVVAPPHCPPATDNEVAVVKAAPHILHEVLCAEEQGYDAVTVDCMLEPGLDAAKMESKLPVVGAAEAAVAIALIRGGRFSIVVPTSGCLSAMHAKMRCMGVESRLASILHADIGVLELQNRDAALTRISSVARHAVTEDGADVIVLGCTVMGAVRADLERSLGLPVVDPGVAALKLAEALVHMVNDRSA